MQRRPSIHSLVGGWRDPGRDAAAHHCPLLLPGGQLFSGGSPFTVWNLGSDSTSSPLSSPAAWWPTTLRWLSLYCVKSWQRLNKLFIFLSCCLVANYSQVTVPLLCEILAAAQQAHHCPFLLSGGQLFSGDWSLYCVKSWQRLKKLTVVYSATWWPTILRGLSL